ncbi:hexameric tyrosine-coordinated heme protein [Marinobacter sp. VGCF2001]|uniref:hexameric tyrosine-coordinated heme protein n=1 Tax=Marinobacter sp. VGCF2001 TaxID=3417189 RepID=UPI003CE81393
MIHLKRQSLMMLVALLVAFPLTGHAEDGKTSGDWLPTLITETPQQGFELAIKLSRMGVKSTQSNKEVLFRERTKYSQDGEALIHASEVIAVHFQTVAEANGYWK